ncbi:Alpha/Beta hydrolase protein [Xylariales sp. PMI_506]|nr:Alpha/Beta hydrolase protein [Xylariales sp. PMI_506]
MLESDFKVNLEQFDPNNVPESTKSIGKAMMAMDAKLGDQWRDLPKFRTFIEGTIQYLPQATDLEIPSREAGRSIPCRSMLPENGQAPRGIFLHIHGGGIVLGSHTYNDGLLLRHANASGCQVISVGYRLSPEHPYPEPVNDIADAVDYFVTRAEADFKLKLEVIGGESAGAYLSMQAIHHLLKTHPDFNLPSIIFSYGLYTYSFLPSVYLVENPLLVDRNRLAFFRDAYLPQYEKGFNHTETEGEGYDDPRKDPGISPSYADLSPYRGRLPRALFLCGTEDVFLDDTVLASFRWQINGGDAVVRFVPGAPHGISEFPPESSAAAKEASDIISQFFRTD